MARKNWNDHLSDFNLEDSGDYNYRGAFYAIASRDKSLMGMLVLSLLMLLAAVIGGVFPATGATDTWYVILPFGLSIAISGVLAYHVFRIVRAYYSKEASSTSGLMPVDHASNPGPVDNSETRSNPKEHLETNRNPEEGQEFDASNPGPVGNAETDPEGFFDRSGRGLVREYIYNKTWPRIGPMTKAVTLMAALTIITETAHLIVNGKGEHFGGAILLLVCMAVTSGLSLLILSVYNSIKWLKLAKNQ